MQIIDADPNRMIDLPGVGPCLRPVDIDESVTGFQTLKSLRIYAFEAGQTIEGESEGDEVYVVPIGGAVDLAVSGAHPVTQTLSEDGMAALYMAPDHAYRLTPASSSVKVAYARAASNGTVPCHAVSGADGTRAETLRFSVVRLDEGATLDRSGTGERLIHVIAGRVSVGGTKVKAAQTAALAAGEDAEVSADEASRVLVVRV